MWSGDISIGEKAVKPVDFIASCDFERGRDILNPREADRRAVTGKDEKVRRFFTGCFL